MKSLLPSECSSRFDMKKQHTHVSWKICFFSKFFFFPEAWCFSSGERSPGAWLVVFVLLCVDSITSCVPAGSPCIQLSDQRRRAAGAHTSVHSKQTHSTGRACGAFYLIPACALIRRFSELTVTFTGVSSDFRQELISLKQNTVEEKWEMGFESLK